MQPTDVFEGQTCSRCQGSGHYSYCPRYGTTCFKCNGTGKVLTQRGQAAYDYYRRFLLEPAENVVVGDKLYIESVPVPGGRGGWMTVENIEEDTSSRRWENGEWITIQALRFSGVLNDEPCGLSIERTMTVKKRWTAEQVEQFRSKALAYQATLTQAGTPRKQSRR